MLGALSLAMCVLAAGVWLLVQRNRSTAVALPDAVAEFRSGEAGRGATEGSSTASQALQNGQRGAERATSLVPDQNQLGHESVAQSDTRPQQTFQKPNPGVYSYETKGFETFTGSRHDYPAATHAIVRLEEGCRWSFTHDVVEEHTDAYWSCAEATELTITEWFLRRQFLGLTLDESYNCSGKGIVWSSAPGESFSFVCQADDEDRIEFEVTHGQPEPVTVDEQRIEAIRLNMRGVMSGGPDGAFTADVWMHPETGLRLRERRVADAEVRAGVRGHYHEEAEFTLVSLSPAT